MTSTVLALLLAVAIPWVFGLMLARWLSGPGRSVFLYLGQGYILGAFAVVWLIKAWDAGGLTLGFWPIAGALMLLSILLLAGMLRGARSGSTIPHTEPSLTTNSWQKGFMLLLCLAMGVHLLFVVQELLLRPTFPWDAWRGWEPKVIQFFANRSLDSPMETIGNYGEVSTLAMLWMMLASETSHEPFLHLPWLLAYLALAAIVYGYLRERSSSLVAALGAYLVTSLPYLNSHVALAGYADIWLTLAFTVGVLGLSEFRRNHRYRQLVLALLMAAACLQAKRAGMGFGAVLLALVVVEIGMRTPKTVGFAVALVIAVAVAALGSTFLGYMDLQLPLPGSHKLLLSSEEFRVTGLIRFAFAPEWQTKPFFEATLLFGNWHLVTYLWLGAIAVVLVLRKWPLLVLTENIGALGGLAVIALYFFLVSPESALDHTGLSRTLLYITPLAIVWLLMSFYQLRARY
tara:strand:- start:73 stop:1449 length:1377 start_codon:yes stop_codon:yes gene_type:complete